MEEPCRHPVAKDSLVNGREGYDARQSVGRSPRGLPSFRRDSLLICGILILLFSGGKLAPDLSEPSLRQPPLPPENEFSTSCMALYGRKDIQVYHRDTSCTCKHVVTRRESHPNRCLSGTTPTDLRRAKRRLSCRPCPFRRNCSRSKRHVLCLLLQLQSGAAIVALIPIAHRRRTPPRCCSAWCGINNVGSITSVLGPTGARH